MGEFVALGVKVWDLEVLFEIRGRERCKQKGKLVLSEWS